MGRDGVRRKRGCGKCGCPSIGRKLTHGISINQTRYFATTTLTDFEAYRRNDIALTATAVVANISFQPIIRPGIFLGSENRDWRVYSRTRKEWAAEGDSGVPSSHGETV
jgi:hypothetical protein